MSTRVCNPTPATLEGQMYAWLHLALGAFSKDLTAQVVTLVHERLGATRPSRKMVEKALVERLTAFLEQSFVTSFLSGKEQAREHRALLSHVLSLAELHATVGADWSALTQATGASKAGGSAEENEWLTSEVASKLLHVSRTHLNTLADSGVLGVIRRTLGGHRRISKAALLKYKASIQGTQSKSLEAMVAASQKLGLYDAELEGLPVKAGG